MKQLSAAAVERAMKLQATDHVVSSSRDIGDQLPADATMEDVV
jgi:hypothetical protein